MSDKSEWLILWDRAKELEKKIPEIKKQYFFKIKEKYPNVKYKNFGSLKYACEQGKHDAELTQLVAYYQESILKFEKEAKNCRVKSEELLELERKSDERQLLDPKIDIIPEGTYPKLKKCKAYPLRKSCDSGENEFSKWDRCEFFKYDNSKSIFDENRWICSAPE